MARYWVGGTANWDGTAGTKWATTSGGAGGASEPTAADDVYFDANSGAVTVTVTAVVFCRNLTTTGFTGTFAGSSNIRIDGSLTLNAGVTFTHSGTLQFTATSGSFTITTAGKTVGAVSLAPLALSTATWTLQDALTTSGQITVGYGTFTTNNYNVTATSLSSSNSNTRAINLGSSTVTLTTTATAINFQTNTGLTFNAGTSTIICSGAGSSINGGASGGGAGVTFYNLSFTPTTATTFNINGANTFNNLTITAPSTAGVTQIIFDSRQTINGTLSTSGTAGNRRVWFRGVTYGLAQTLTINSAPSLTDADFRDIYVVGTAAPISGTRIGDLRGIRGITASTPKSVYWVTAAGGNWSGNNWAASSGGAASTDNFPLAQDTAIIENTGLNTSATVTLDTAIVNVSGIDMSTRTNAMTFVLGATMYIYGDLKYGSGVTTNTGNGFTFSGRNTQTITSNGRTLSGNLLQADTYGGTLQLADALSFGTGTIQVVNGTFDTKNYNVTAGTLSSDNSNVRTITLGSSTLTLSGLPAIQMSTTTNCTLNAGTSSVVQTGTPSSQSFNSTGLTWYNVSFTSTSVKGWNISGANTFNDLSFTAPASAGLSFLSFAGNCTINGTLTVAGATAVRRIFVRSNTLGTTRTLTVNTLSATDCDFRDITIAGTAAGSSPTRAGDCGGNSGITFPSPKTVYWNLAGTQNWSADGWATSSGGAPATNNFPLAQDTAVFDNTGSAGTVTIDQAWNIGTLNASARTSAMTLTTSTNTPTVYGNWLFGTGVTSSSTTGTITFAKRGTQTITSNGVQFGCPITIDCVTGTTNLGDALSLGSTRTFTLTSGTFDAVSYNVTTGLCSVSGSTTRTLKMGSGTWTLAGTGNIWDASTITNLNFYKGTANITLSDTSSSARTFIGGGLSYNKLTIGGTTGTSTTTISGDNQFTELASTKTVAHTIALGSTTQTFGKWSVTGTLGNVVTLTGTGTSHVLAGAATSGIDYLAMGSIGFAATSPGEFYAGANSTGTASAPVYRTAPPAATTRYWVGGTGTWDATTTTNWSTSSGGAGGASVPTSLDNVIFDTSSSTANAAYTVTIGTGATVRAKAITMGGPGAGNNITWAGSGTMVMHDDFDLTAGTADCTRTFTGAIVLSGSTSGFTFTTNGVTLASDITVNGVNSQWALGSALTTGASSNIQLQAGTFDTANYNVSAARFQILAGPSTTLTLGSSTITENTIGFTAPSTAINFTLNAGTSTINNLATSPTFSGNNQTFYNVSFTSTSAGTVTLNGANTFNNLSFTGLTSAGLKNIALAANQTVNGTLTFSAGTNATMRHFCRSDTIGTTRTLTCAAVSLTDVDFRDITIAGAAAPVSGTRLGDAKGNSGITFVAGKTVYVRSTGSANWSSSTGWSATSGGAADVTQFPLAQDTAVFPAATYPSSGSTITIDFAYNIGTIDMSLRTSNTVTLATSTSTPTIYGNWINGTGTTLSGTDTLTFAGRGSQTITSAGKTWTQLFSINTPGGSVTLQDAFTASQSSSNVLALTAGTFDAATYNLTLSGASANFSTTSTATFSRTVAVGSGTWSIAGSNFAWDLRNLTNATVTGTGTISLTSASAKTFAGGGVSYSGITLDNGGAGTLTITGNNTFKDITNSYKATGAANITIGTTTQTVSQFTAAGESGRVLTVQGSSASSPGTLVLSTTTKPNVDYLTITGVRAYSLDTTWYAGTNSTNNGSLGWYFEVAPVSGTTNNFFLVF
jgi:fibronectin-binding autotransporter adhesin